MEIKSEIKIPAEVLSAYDKDLATFRKLTQDAHTSDPFSLICALADQNFSNYKITTEYFQKIIPYRKDQHEIRNIALYHHKLRNGGIERVMSLLSELFTRPYDGKQYHVIIVTEETPSHDDYPVPETVERVSIPSFSQCRNQYELRGQALLDLIDKYDIDVFISNVWLLTQINWDILTIKTSRKSPAYLIHTHNFCAALWKVQGNPVKATWDFYPLADGVITLSDADRIYWRNTNPHTYKIANPPELSKDQSKNQWKDGPHEILWVGRLSPEKQPFEMVKIMSHVVRSFPDVRCRILGGEYEFVSRPLEKCIRENGLQNNVILEGFHANVEPFYRNADIFVSTSEFEGFPMTFMESAAHGVPTVFYDLPWLEYKNIIKGYKCVEQLNAEGAAACIISLLSDRNKWEESSLQIYQSYQTFKAHDLRKGWENIFHDCQTSTKTLQNDAEQNFSIILRELVNSLYVPVETKQKELDAVYRSASWRIGQKVVGPLHKIKMLLQRMKLI